jgi:hypothetical protein
MNALNGKLDEESITKSIDLREKLNVETNKVAGLEAQENTLGLEERINTEKGKIAENELLAEKHALEYKHQQAMKVIPEKVTETLAQQRVVLFKSLNESDAKL